MTALSVAVEGGLDAAVAERLCAEIGWELGPVFVRRGKQNLDVQLAGYNNAAARAPWLVLRDLDQDAACAPDLVAALLPQQAAFMRLRIPVHEIEAWLLADRAKIATYLGIRATDVPNEPEALPTPKRTLVTLAARSRSRVIREGIVPRAGTRTVVGPEYNSLMADYVFNQWRPAIARLHSESLHRCINRLDELLGLVPF